MARKRKHEAQSSSAPQAGEPHAKVRKLEGGKHERKDSTAPVIAQKGGNEDGGLWERFKDKTFREEYKGRAETSKEEKEAYKIWKRWRRERKAGKESQGMVDDNAAVPATSEDDGGIMVEKKSRKDKKREKMKSTGKSQDEIERVVKAEHKEQRKKKKRRKSFGDSSEGGADPSSPEEPQVSIGKTSGVHDENIIQQDADTESGDANDKRFKRASKMPRHQKDDSNTHKHSERAVLKEKEWTVTDSTGGRMLDIDPIFSPDEEYIIIAYSTHVTVYATKTSLPVRKLVTDTQRIVALALTSDTDTLLIGISDGHVELWNWIDGERIMRWELQKDLQLLQYINGTADEAATILTSQKKDDEWLVYQHSLKAGTRKSTSKHIFTHENRVDNIVSFDEGRYVIMSSGYHLICGIQREDSYTWRTVTSPEYISSIDIRREKSATKKSKVRFDIAIGGMKGSIHIYEDILTKLMKNTQITSRKLHWHRNAVMALKWSTDGNYLISSGQETTLVQWQLDSSRKDFLPHLGAPIENIVVSPSGGSYAIHLADNSAMVLSTAGLEPTFSVAGIQTPTMGKHHFPALITADVHSKPLKSTRTSAPACICPSNPGQILLAVPAHSSFRMSTPSTFSSAYLQTVDLESGGQLYKQAVARTNVTVMNMGPGGNMIEEPNVTHLACSQNGKWLATVDEWVPPRTDNADLAFDEESETAEQVARREVYLKFWTWSPASNTWNLVSRIDKPHIQEYSRAARIVSLISNPASNAFATLGEDGSLKTWSPTTRIRSGMEVKDQDGPLTTWKCQFSLSLPLNSGPASMTWAQDGSVIAVSSQSDTSIHLIDALDGKIEKTLPALHSAPLFSLGILERYLLILSPRLIIYDLVTDTTKFSIALDIPDAPLYMLSRYTHLAVNAATMTFAATIPVHAEEKELYGARLAVFDPQSSTPLLYHSLKTTITALLPAPEKKGFYALDSAAEVRVIAPSDPHEPIDFDVPEELELPEMQDTGPMAIFGNGAVSTRAREADDSEEVEERESRYITTAQWEKVYEPDPVSKRLPSVEAMFERTMGLILGRGGEDVGVKG